MPDRMIEAVWSDGYWRVPLRHECYLKFTEDEWQEWRDADSPSAALWRRGITRGKAEQRAMQHAQRLEQRRGAQEAKKLGWIR